MLISRNSFKQYNTSLFQNFLCFFLGRIDGYWGPSEWYDVPFCQTAVVCRGLSPSQTYTLQLASQAPGKTIGSLYNRSLILPHTVCLIWLPLLNANKALWTTQHEHCWGGDGGKPAFINNQEDSIYRPLSCYTSHKDGVLDTIANSGQLMPPVCNQDLMALIIEPVLSVVSWSLQLH